MLAVCTWFNVFWIILLFSHKRRTQVCQQRQQISPLRESNRCIFKDNKETDLILSSWRHPKPAPLDLMIFQIECLNMQLHGFSTSSITNYLSWRSGQISDEWKLGHIVPISKSPYINSPNDYWPVSFLSIISNDLEHDIQYTAIRNLCINSPLTLLLSMGIYERSIHSYYITVYNWWIVTDI